LGYILLLAVLYAIGYVTLPAVRNWFATWFYKRVFPPVTDGKPVEAMAAKPATEVIPEMPAKLVAYANSWPDAWVTEDVLERAKRLWLEHHDWDVVYQQVLAQDGEKA
jgi:hypothetical protein